MCEIPRGSVWTRVLGGWAPNFSVLPAYEGKWEAMHIIMTGK